MVMAVHGYLRTFFGLPKIKPWTIVHGFRPENENFDIGKKMISLERASQEEQNDTNFSFIAPSSELLVLTYTCLPFKCRCMVKVFTAVDYAHNSPLEGTT